MVSRFKRQVPPWAFTLPAILPLAAVAGWPLLRTFYDSLTDAKLGNLDHPQWLGLENYAYLVRDPDWWRSVLNTCVFTAVSVTLETVFGLGTALLLNSKLRARGWVRTAVLVPWAIPAVVSARIWAWMLNDLYGVINEILLRLKLTHGQTAWLSDDRLSLATLVVVDVWKTTPFMALILLAGLQSIPGSVYEAARVDGASPWDQFTGITLPLLRPALWVAMLFRTLDAMRIFDLPFVLTSNSRSTAVVSIYARQQMVDYQAVGYGSAASFLIFCTIACVAVAYLRAIRKDMGWDE